MSDIDHLADIIVAPLAGAWIEITEDSDRTQDLDVAPLAGDKEKPEVVIYRFCKSYGLLRPRYYRRR